MKNKEEYKTKVFLKKIIHPGYYGRTRYKLQKRGKIVEKIDHLNDKFQ